MAEFVLGQGRDEERLGAIEYNHDWEKFTGPVDIGDTEYAFARCSKSKKEAILINKFNETAAARAKKLTQEMKERLNMTDEVRPIGVYMLIFDSVSRQHFYRNFPETIEFLNRNVGGGKYGDKFAVHDFVVNNAHGENTQPNMVPWLYGYSLKYHKNRLQGFSIHRPEDEWKYVQLQEESLWKIFEKHGFVTLFGFDTVWDFLSHSTGRTIATDHVISNFYHACRKLFGYMDFVERQRCIGLHNAHYYSLSYLKQFHHTYKGLNRFAYIHLSPGHEKSGTVIRTADTDLMLFLESILDEQKVRKEEDFVLVIAADHGKHSNEWDKMQEGFLENQLPVHLMITNSKLLARLGHDTPSILTHNTQRLVSRLDWHVTFRHMATFPYGNLKVESPLYDSWKQMSDSNQSLSVFLERIPDERECMDVGIPMYYCSCMDFQEIPLIDALKTRAVVDLVDVSHRISLGFVSLESILKATVQLVKPGSSDNRNFKIRIAAKEGKSPLFEVIGVMSSPSDFSNYRFEELAANSPIVNTTFVLSPTAVPVQMYLQVRRMQLKEVIRVDAYEGICEELALAAGASPAYCLCRVPYPDNTPFPPKLASAIDKLLSKAEVEIARHGQTCRNACLERNKGCHSWAMTLFNDIRVLAEDWKSEGFYPVVNLTSGERTHFRDMSVETVKRTGNTIRLVRRGEKKGGTWALELATWGDGPSCDEESLYGFCLCPCF